MGGLKLAYYVSVPHPGVSQPPQGHGAAADATDTEGGPACWGARGVFWSPPHSHAEGTPCPAGLPEVGAGARPRAPPAPPEVHPRPALLHRLRPGEPVPTATSGSPPGSWALWVPPVQGSAPQDHPTSSLRSWEPYSDSHVPPISYRDPPITIGCELRGTPQSGSPQPQETLQKQACLFNNKHAPTLTQPIHTPYVGSGRPHNNKHHQGTPVLTRRATPAGAQGPGGPSGCQDPGCPPGLTRGTFLPPELVHQAAIPVHLPAGADGQARPGALQVPAPKRGHGGRQPSWWLPAGAGRAGGAGARGRVLGGHPHRGGAQL